MKYVMLVKTLYNINTTGWLAAVSNKSCWLKHIQHEYNWLVAAVSNRSCWLKHYTT